MLYLEPQLTDFLLIDDADLVDSQSGRRTGFELVIHGSRIVHIGPSGSFTAPEEKISRLSLPEHSLIPGLWDTHVHLVGSRAGRDPFRRYLERDMSVRAFRIAADATGFLEAGVTSIRHLGHGHPNHVRIVAEALAKGTIVGPRIESCGWAVSQSGGHGDEPQWPYDLVERLQPSAAFCDGSNSLRRFVENQARQGASWIKVFATQGVVSTPEKYADLPNFSLEEMKAIVDEARELGLRVAAHATGLEGAQRAVRAGVDTLEHGPSSVNEAFVHEMLGSGVTLVPTLSVTAWAAAEGQNHGLADWAVQSAVARLEEKREALRIVAEAGVPLALGSDSGTLPRPMGTAEEVRQLLLTGFSPRDVLEMATVSAASAMGGNSQEGTLNVGSRADIAVVTVDPLKEQMTVGDPDNVAMVIRDGLLLRKSRQ